jgi:hypothetical protein
MPPAEQPVIRIVFLVVDMVQGSICESVVDESFPETTEEERRSSGTFREMPEIPGCRQSDEALEAFMFLTCPTICVSRQASLKFETWCQSKFSPIQEAVVFLQI